MKKEIIKTFVISAITMMLVLPVNGQKGVDDGSKYGHGQDSINCLMNLSLYREFFKHDNYTDAISPWRLVFTECPASSEQMYLDGVKMYKDLIEAMTSDPKRNSELIDTLMLIYDRRIQNFGGEGNILGRKAIDLLRYRRDDIQSVALAHGWLKRSLDLEEKESRDVVFVVFVSSAISLEKAGMIDSKNAIEDYFYATTLIDAILAKKKSSSIEKAQATINETMLASGILTCESLNAYFEPQFDEGKENQQFLEKVIKFYDATGCNMADVYAKASELLYAMSPTPEAALPLARMFLQKNEWVKASKYYKEAITSATADNISKATIYYELAYVTEMLKDYCEGIGYAKEAIALNPDFGKAYILLGDLYIAGKGSLGDDDFQQRTAFWAAADKYSKAKTVDPSVAGDATKRISDYMSQYPNGEDIFFRTLKEGDSFLVKGCINEYTTVRARP
ncbi:MAG: tetratricopeptide repeat protein [Bacteroidota bacterium]